MISCLQLLVLKLGCRWNHQEPPQAPPPAAAVIAVGGSLVCTQGLQRLAGHSNGEQSAGAPAETHPPTAPKRARFTLKKSIVMRR